MRRRTRFFLTALSSVFLAACTDNPTGLEPVAAVSDQAPSLAVASTPAGPASLTISAADMTDCGGVADVSIKVTGRDEARPLDIAVLMDASSGIGSANFTLMKQRIAAMIDTIGVAAAGNHMTIIQFAGSATAWHPFASPQTNSAVKSTVNARPYTGGASYMRNAVQLAINQWDAHGHADARRVMILVTDGNPNPASTQEPCALAAQLTSRGVHTFIFGLGANWTASVVQCLVSDAASQIHEPARLDQMSAALRSRIEQRAGVKNVTVSATLGAGFVLDGSPSLDLGSVSISGSTVTWTLAELGAAERTLTLPVRAADASGAATLVSGGSITYTSGGTTATQSVGAVSVNVGSCDDTPPEIAADVTGTPGRDGWYVSDVALAWQVNDPESPVTMKGCDKVSVIYDTEGVTFECAAKSAGGVSTLSHRIRRDATRPVINLHSRQSTYQLGDLVEVECTAGDALSGLAESDCESVSAPAWSIGAGTHTIAASATDVAGNSANASASFTVIVNVAGVCQLTKEWVSQPGLASALCKMLERADRAPGRARGRAGRALVRSYVKAVRRLPPRLIEREHRAALIDLAGGL